MKPNYNQRRPQMPNEIWNEFIRVELQTNSKLGKAFEKAGFGGIEDKTVILYFEDEGLAKAAKGQTEPLKKKLSRNLQPCERVEVRIGQVSLGTQAAVAKPVVASNSSSIGRSGNPLQALCLDYPVIYIENSPQAVLTSAMQAEVACTAIYDRLNERTRILAGTDGVVFPVSFGWRMRVGGTRGFQDLLLPVFHPVFGIPYIPASSLKGAARAWARQNKSSSEIEQILGVLRGNTAKAAKVEFLDSFPIQPCLNVDVATPQWHWQDGKVTYQPVPHPLLSLKQPQFLIGLCPTKPENAHYISVVQTWLENALKQGIGSRVSSGYGRALGQLTALPYSQSFNFELWTQGIYGSEPPSKHNKWQGKSEFRPTAIRGILRYWFRAVALSLYDAANCQKLEEVLFGKLGQQGQFSVSLVFNTDRSSPPYVYRGRIHLEATKQEYIDLLSQLLILATHLGGVGRGSRRPLHLLNGRMRGCHWGLDAADLPLTYDKQKWQQFLAKLRGTFEAIQLSVSNFTSGPGKPRQRQQDVLDKNAQVWLLQSPNQILPDEVRNWQTEGYKPAVLGSALSLLYSNSQFKGKNQEGRGNENVGGAFETPSFVWIKSIFPIDSSPYQVVTIFGTDHPDRLAFAKALQSEGGELVFGSMPSGNASSSLKPIKRQREE